VADHQGVRDQGGVNAVVGNEIIQIHLTACGGMDCSSLSLLAMTFYAGILSSFCRQRATFTSAGISVSGKLVFQSVTPTSPT
jgi:hypothetical protein